MSVPEFGKILEEDTTVEFGRVIEEPSKSSVEFGRVIEEPSKSSKSMTRRIGKAFSRGALKATGNILDFFRPELTPEEQFSFVEAVDTLLPRDSEAGFSEKTIERGVQILPYLLGGEASLIAKVGRAGLASLLGQITEEAGGGELAQAGSEIIGLGVPGLGKNIMSTKGQQKGVEMLRKRGLTEKEIAPLIPTEKKSAVLGKVATKGFKTAKAAKQTREALGNVYSQISEEGSKLPILSSGRAQSLESELRGKLQKLPSSVRRSIEADMQDLFSKPVKANDIINFWQDLNSEINWKKIGGSKNSLNSLKNSLKKGLEDISPELAADFELTNNFYSKFNKISRNLQPKDLDKLIALGEMGSVIGGLLKFGPKGAIPAIGGETLRRIASEMLINPRLQNLTKQMITAVNNNKLAIAKKVQDVMVKELKKSGIELSTSKIPESQTTNPE